MSNFPVLFILLSHCIQVSFQNRTNNVCKTNLDYYKDIKNNPQCYYNPDVHLPVPEIIKRHGYPLQTYTAVTKDGYILTVFRIPHGRGIVRRNEGPPVFIQHGMSQSSTIFVNLGKKSLGFTLVDAGYDVWLGNFRGCQYSNKHRYLDNNDKVYWNFTFHENGIYDLPVQLNLVTRVTKRKVIYIGYSMGSTAYFVYNTQYPEMAEKTIRVCINMASVAFLKHLGMPMKILINAWAILRNAYDETGNGAMYQRTNDYLANRLKTCFPYPVQMRYCLLPDYLFGLIDMSQEDPELLPIAVMQNQDAVSFKTINHYSQFIRSGRFEQYDYKNLNDKIYGSPVPSEYDLSKIRVPIIFIRANKDTVATKENIEEIVARLPKSAKPFNIFTVNCEGFAHSDFMNSKDVKKLVYELILDILNKNKNKFL